jgi:hypothetical protein
MVIVNIFSVYVEFLKCVKLCFLLFRLKICMLFWMFPKGWLCSMSCYEYFDAWQFFLYACLCSLKIIWKFLPVWPTYASLHIGHVSLYILVSVYLSFVFSSSLCRSLFHILLLVRNDIIMFVRLKILVINVVSFPVYLNVTYFFCSVEFGFFCLYLFRGVVF